MTTLTSTTFCDAPDCPGHVKTRDYPGQRVTLTDDPARPLALIPETDQ